MKKERKYKETKMYHWGWHPKVSHRCWRCSLWWELRVYLWLPFQPCGGCIRRGGSGSEQTWSALRTRGAIALAQHDHIIISIRHIHENICLFLECSVFFESQFPLHWRTIVIIVRWFRSLTICLDVANRPVSGLFHLQIIKVMVLTPFIRVEN